MALVSRGPEPPPVPLVCSFCGAPVDPTKDKLTFERQVVDDGESEGGYLRKRPGKGRYTHAVCPTEDA